MEELLTKLYDSLCEAFQENLKPKEIFKFDDESSIDVFKTLMFLKKHNNVLNNLMLQGAVSIDELKYLLIYLNPFQLQYQNKQILLLNDQYNI